MMSLVKRKTVAAVVPHQEKFPVAPEVTYADDDIYQAYKAKLQIDQSKLDTCIQQQATTYLAVQEEYTLAVSRRDEARDQLSRRDAELARDIRIDLTKRGEKTTEAIVNDCVMLSPAHIKASDHLAACKRSSDRWGALVGAFEQRLRMLRELVALYSAGYWSAQSIDGSAAAVRDGLAASAKEKLQQGRDARRQKGGL